MKAVENHRFWLTLTKRAVQVNNEGVTGYLASLLSQALQKIEIALGMQAKLQAADCSHVEDQPTAVPE